MNPIDFIKHLIKILRAKPYIPESLSDNEPLQMILHRRSIRKFSDQDLPDDVFQAILEAGRLAPSTVNLQTWHFIAFTKTSWKRHFGRQIPFKGNRAVIILGDMNRTKQVITTFPYSPLVEYTTAVINASLAAMNMNIAAEALQVSSVMLSETGKSGYFDAHYLKEKLLLPDGVFPLMTMVLGYSQGGFAPMPPKLPLEAVLSNAPCYEEADMEILRDWYNQMTAGYKAAFPLSSFKAQLEHYRKNIERAEKELHDLIFYKNRHSISDEFASINGKEGSL
jgi:nitroreductase